MDARGKHLWQGMLRAVMHRQGAWPWVARVAAACVRVYVCGGGSEQTGHRQRRRRGLKKAEPGVWWA